MIMTRILFGAVLGLTATMAAAQQTDFINVSLDAWHQSDDLAINPNYDDVLMVIGSCNATNQAKTIEGWVRKPGNSQGVLVASLSGMTGRQSITIVVPPNWAFKVVVNKQGGVGVPAGGACGATAWWTD